MRHDSENLSTFVRASESLRVKKTTFESSGRGFTRSCYLYIMARYSYRGIEIGRQLKDDVDDRLEKKRLCSIIAGHLGFDCLRSQDQRCQLVTI
jgi:hypothetical protein